MATYAIWNNKGGVGKSYLTFQIACEYARIHPSDKVLVLDLCPQANASTMLLGGMEKGEITLDALSILTPRKSISGYIEDRIISPYINPKTGSNYLVHVSEHNSAVPSNLFLVPGDEQLEVQGSRVFGATYPGPADAWRVVHTWISDLIADIRHLWDQPNTTVFIDCNPSFSIYTELALSASDRLIIPFNADGSSKRAVRAVLALIYGVNRVQGSMQSQFFLNSIQFRLNLPTICCYVGNRLTQYKQAARAYKTVVDEIGNEIWDVWKKHPNIFRIQSVPKNQGAFKAQYQMEVADANTASVVSSALGIPFHKLVAGKHDLSGRSVVINQTQLDKQYPDIEKLARRIE